MNDTIIEEFDSDTYTPRFVTSDGRFRVQLARDDAAGPPDGDEQGVVLRRYWTNFGSAHITVERAEGDAHGLASRLSAAHENGGSAAAEKALDRMGDHHTFASRSHQGGDDFILIITPDMWTSWGCELIDGHVPPGSAKVYATEWQAWLDGDVYGWILARRVTRRVTVTDPDGTVIRETSVEGWDQVESCWGFYGDDYAAQCARQALEDHVARLAVSA